MVKNTSTEEPVTIPSLSDSIYGTLAGDADCMVGTVLAAAASCEFSITEWVEGDYSGPDHVNVFTAVAEDNDGTDATDNDDATVDFTNVLPYIEVTKTANPTAVPETGGNVVFTFVVKNTSTEEPVTITSLSDSVYGTLAGDADCHVGTILAANVSCTFSITRWVEGDYESGMTHVDVFTAHAVDNDGSDATDDDDAVVTFTDLTAEINVVKWVKVSYETFWRDADSVKGPYALEGSVVQFKFVVSNTGTAPLSNISLTDSDFDLTGCTIPATLAVGAPFECIISTTAVLGQHTNTATAGGSFIDGAGNTESDSDTDPANYFGLPKVRVNKTVNGLPFSGPELTFQIRKDAAPVTGEFGTILETRYANVANNGQVTFQNLYLPGTYQLCEIVPPGYVPSYIWGPYGVEWFKPGYAPGQGGLDPVLTVCVNFVIAEEGTLTFQDQIVLPGNKININNQVGQMPLTIGFWKNHSSASGSNGGQIPYLDRMLYELTQAGHTLHIGVLWLPGGATPDDAGESAVNIGEIAQQVEYLYRKEDGQRSMLQPGRPVGCLSTQPALWRLAKQRCCSSC